ncbi:MAG TPA: hypothetical protein VN772_03365, partial [Solirubrobacteraceae bacterium]|nr:hypothetical protein [Solirubrobacteraceae bacterium]
MRRLRRISAVVFAGDRRVWRVAGLAAVPLLALLAYYCLKPRDYYTGTNSVEAYGYIAPTQPGEPMCVPGLRIPAGTARIRLVLISRTRARPALSMSLTLAGAAPMQSRVAPEVVGASRVSNAIFPINTVTAPLAQGRASLCVRAADLVNWAGTPLPLVPSTSPATAGGHPLSG